MIDNKNLALVRHSFATCVFTHKIQEIASEKCEAKLFAVKVFNVILVALVLIMFFLQIRFPQELLWSYVGSGLTVSEVLFLIVQLSFDFEQRAVTHKNSALKYLGLRDSYKNLMVDILNEMPLENLVERRDYCQKQFELISELSPQTNRKHYNEAQKRLNKDGLKVGEDFTWSDEEINWFLPSSLRIN